MCKRPIKIDEESTVACRTCDECLAARNNDWIARAVAETNVATWAAVFNLTYEAGELGAEVFRYADIRKWIKNIRESLYAKHGTRPNLRFMVCGEMGSKKGRCHWHVILWCDFNVVELGKWSDFKSQWALGLNPSDGPEPSCEVVPFMDRAHQKIWSLWPHGHLTIDNADQNGVKYVTKYILKDQMNVQASAGTKRQSKAETFSASYFRVSKAPPIGHRWLDQKIEQWKLKGAVPPKLNLKIDNYDWYWWPKGTMREKLLLGLHEVNQQHRASHGRDVPQWKGLIQWCENLSLYPDIWVLKYGETLKQWKKDRTDGKEEKDFIPRLERKRKKGDIEPAPDGQPCQIATLCRDCTSSLTERDYQRYERYYRKALADYREDCEGGLWNPTADLRDPHQAFDQWFKEKRTVNQYCRFTRRLTGARQ